MDPILIKSTLRSILPTLFINIKCETFDLTIVIMI